VALICKDGCCIKGKRRNRQGGERKREREGEGGDSRWEVDLRKSSLVSSWLAVIPERLERHLSSSLGSLSTNRACALCLTRLSSSHSHARKHLHSVHCGLTRNTKKCFPFPIKMCNFARSLAANRCYSLLSRSRISIAYPEIYKVMSCTTDSHRNITLLNVIRMINQPKFSVPYNPPYIC
jgi:hypothetical protein